MSVFSAPSFDQHELVVFHKDAKSKLQAIIAIHNTARGPALGGCRMFDYASDEAALDDVLRLSRGMSYKSALAGLPLGGGKAVILGNPATEKSRPMLLAMGDFIESLGGRYVGAEDSGTCVADLATMQERTSHVAGVSKSQRFGGDPSPYTAYGVFCGIQAALRYQRGSEDLRGVRIAIQGVGAVGRHLAERLLNAGAKVFVADVNADNVRRIEALGAIVVAPSEILQLEVDVLAPCAMGAILSEALVEQVQATIIAGAANNQLASAAQAETLRSRGIVYAPDFVINAGGIIDVYYQHCARGEPRSEHKVERHVENISEVLNRIFRQAEKERRSTHAVAESMAQALFQSAAPSEGAVNLRAKA